MSENNLKMAKLREPFPENLVNWLPKPMLKREEMDKIPKHTCPVCGQWHAKDKIMHLAYVGHAALTDRILDVDPSWTWEPLAFDDFGLPRLDHDGGMWIRLTILGVTRLGYGDAGAKKGPDATKERIGDALRNAGMRFGCALEYWHKGDLNQHKTIPAYDEPEPVVEQKAQEPITDERLFVAIAKIKTGEFTLARLYKNFTLTDAQEARLTQELRNDPLPLDRQNNDQSTVEN